MAGKRKRSDSDDAPESPLPHPPWRGDGNYDEDSSLSDYSGDSRSDIMCLSDSDDEHYSSYPVPDHVSGGGSNEESQIAELLAFLNISPLSHVPAEAEVQPSSPADHPAAAEVADQSVAAAAPADSVLCLGCGREPASVRLVPVEHACFCQPCRSSGWSFCAFCDGPRR